MDFSSFSFSKYLRAAALAVNGVEPVELNPKFMEELINAAKGEGIILYDEIGGTLEPTATFGSGKTSRSLLAVYQVREAKALQYISICTWKGQSRGACCVW